MASLSLVEWYDKWHDKLPLDQGCYVGKDDVVFNALRQAVIDHSGTAAFALSELGRVTDITMGIGWQEREPYSEHYMETLKLALQTVGRLCAWSQDMREWLKQAISREERLQAEGLPGVDT